MEQELGKIYDKTTLDQLGASLPVLRYDQDKKPVADSTFSFLEWDMETEEKIAKIQKKARNVGQMVSQILCLLLDRFCGTDFQALPKDQQILLVNQLEFTNVMYMYIYLRTEELGYELKLDVTCPTCKKLNKDFVADLRTLEIHTKNETCQREHVYQLQKPVIMSDGVVVSALGYDVARWDVMERATADVAENGAKMKQLLFMSSIRQVKTDKDDAAKILVESVVKKMKKIDIEKISAAIVENNAGPLMAMKGVCVHCESEWFRMLDWSYNYFFDSSSLP